MKRASTPRRLSPKQIIAAIGFLLVLEPAWAEGPLHNEGVEKKIDSLLTQMTLSEKIGQMCQIDGGYGKIPADLRKKIRNGEIGSLLNEVNVDTANEIQEEALQSRHKIPLLIGRDVIHGFRTIFPIPLGQASSFNTFLIKDAQRIAAREARASGVNWTFAPMLDVARDPRWGRIAETLGEDPFLTGEIARAMVNGFQHDGDLSHKEAIAACAKHYVAYGAVEAGKDYNTVTVSDQALWDVHLPPFKAALEAGVATFMTAFNEINGVPATANQYTIKQILKERWGFGGFVVSDWAATDNMLDHGYARDGRDIAFKTIRAAVDMEMVSSNYRDHLQWLVNQKRVEEQEIDNAVRRILRIKALLGLFENPYCEKTPNPYLRKDAKRIAHELAKQSLVLLKNEGDILPLKRHKIKKIAVLGSFADAPHDQMGTWVFDGKEENTITPFHSINALFEENRVLYDQVFTHSRDTNTNGFKKALELSILADVTLLFVGEESILSGEAHSRAHLTLPGAQSELINFLSENTKTPIVLVVMAGRPLSIGKDVEKVSAVLYAWHPGTMGGPAITDILFGMDSPSGRLPVTFPRSEGQIPIYYAHKNTGRPPLEPVPTMKTIKVGAHQTSLGNRSVYLDESYKPLYPFGYGLTYGKFTYSNLGLKRKRIAKNQSVELSFRLKNVGKRKATEVVQVYVRDKVASLTRPVKELRHFERVTLQKGHSKNLTIPLPFSSLGFHNPENKFVVEKGRFEIWVGPNAENGLHLEFEVDASIELKTH